MPQTNLTPSSSPPPSTQHTPTQGGGTSSLQPADPPAPAAQPKLLGNALLYPTLAIVGCSCLTWALRKRAAARPKTPAIDSDHLATVAELNALRSDLNELGERLAQKLDHKAAHLESLLARAEQASEELRNLRASTTQAGTHLATPPARSDGFIESPAALDPLHARVAELADQGLAPVQIAQRLGQPTGQVELILALRRRFVRT